MMQLDNVVSQKRKPQMSFDVFMRQMLRGWPIFLLSILVFGLLAIALSNRMQMGVAKYKMGVMTRFSEKDGDVIFDTGKRELLWQKTPPYTIEQLYGMFLSSNLIYRAGLEAGFDVDYSQKKGLRTYDVYNDLPFRLKFLDLYDKDQVALSARWTNGGVVLSDLEGAFRGSPLHLSDKSYEIFVKVGKMVETPVGRIACLAQEPSTVYPATSLDLSRPISVQRIDLNRAKSKFDADMMLNIHARRTLVVEIATAGSTRRVVEVMEKMVAVCEADIRKAIQKDLQENEALLLSSLAKLDNEMLSKQATSAEREYLQAELLRNQSNQSLVELQQFLSIVDPPTGRPAPSGSKGFKLVLLVLAIATPIVVVYLWRIAKPTLFEDSQLSSEVRSAIKARLRYSGEKSSVSSETHLLALDEIRLSLSNTSQLFVYATGKPRESMWIASLLAKNTARSGRTAVRIHFKEKDEKAPLECQVIEVAAGYIGSDAYYKQLAKLQSEFPENTLFIYTASPSLQSLLATQFSDFVVVLVAEKTRLNKSSLMQFPDVTLEESARQVSYVWVDLSLTTSTKR